MEDEFIAMQNTSLVKDYLDRSLGRFNAIELLHKQKQWADVVRQSQEVVELSLKALLRHAHIESPRIHDVSDVMLQNKLILEKIITATDLKKMAKISRSLRRDRELSFYGSEDLTPSEFYQEDDAEEAKSQCYWLLMQVRKAVGL